MNADISLESADRAHSSALRMSSMSLAKRQLQTGQCDFETREAHEAACAALGVDNPPAQAGGYRPLSAARERSMPVAKPAVALKHSRITKHQMLDWIRECIERGAPMPSDGEIADRFRLSGVESARVLLADLADERRISIKWARGERTITLGAREKEKAILPRPLPTVRKPKPAAITVDEGLAKLDRILNRRTTLPIRMEPHDPAPPSQSIVVPPAQPSPAPTPPKERKMPPAPATPPEKITIARARRRQINSKVDKAMYDAVNALAKQAGVSTSAMCGRLVEEALTARTAGSAQHAKPHIPADVMAAYLADGRDFKAFIIHLLNLGLAEHRQREAG